MSLRLNGGIFENLETRKYWIVAFYSCFQVLVFGRQFFNLYQERIQNGLRFCETFSLLNILISEYYENSKRSCHYHMDLSASAHTSRIANRLEDFVFRNFLIRNS
ncbi:hypothetical protein dsmv_1186 [Desulfococcus multivorans DSM 2059]|uniref:Uncharacterized protein n=1 Tax=Desulfococcus multivorans DSM 2059 TaxID=1121405 RepID=S7U337_DESML|nr:hypothetical protein dsmv_1186 [Desulfococcus multivorans DSM 2059]SKA25804.1 hypothetical protein SAMN02745446_03577 [Desulfococcus multivorans DSM 2059]